ncbi:MAG: hypothetical protein Q4C61_01805 [Lachnospiraceae bacterium]|nr:hypothetical protein [Lachnospiraceae bacterium]
MNGYIWLMAAGIVLFAAGAYLFWKKGTRLRQAKIYGTCVYIGILCLVFPFYMWIFPHILEPYMGPRGIAVTGAVFNLALLALCHYFLRACRWKELTRARTEGECREIRELLKKNCVKFIAETDDGGSEWKWFFYAHEKRMDEAMRLLYEWRSEQYKKQGGFGAPNEITSAGKAE